MRKRYVFYLTDKNADLRERLDSQPNKSEVIILALAAWFERYGDAPKSTLDADVLRAVIREEFDRRAFVVGSGNVPTCEGNEDAEVKAGMGGLVGTWDLDDDGEEANGDDDLPNE